MEGVIRRVQDWSFGRSRGARWERRRSERHSLIVVKGHGNERVAHHDEVEDQRTKTLGTLLARKMRDHLVGVLEL